MAFLSVRYDRQGFAGAELHDSVEECLEAAREDGCLFATIGDHPRAESMRHFAYHDDGWRELENGEELDRLRGMEEQPRLVEWAA